MTDYLAIALAQWEEVSAIMAEELATAAVETSGGPFFPEERMAAPEPPKKVSGSRPEVPTAALASLRPVEPLAPRTRIRGWNIGEIFSKFRRRYSTQLDALFPRGAENSAFPEVFADPKALGGPAANLAKPNTAGTSRSAAVFDGFLPGSGSGADGTILTSLISRKQKGQKGFLGESGGPFFGLSKNDPPGTFVSRRDEMISAPTPGWRIPSAGDASAQEATLPLLRQLRQAQWGAGFVQGQRRQFTVTLPEAAPTAPPLSAEDFDLTCERDARRYGGGFALY